MRWLTPFSGIYGAAISLRNRRYERDPARAEHLQWPVVSVGNLRAGGSGKTPFVIHLGELLQKRHYPFTVLTRGYRRRSTGLAVVQESGSPEEFGDEPLLISRALHVPVVVGADRVAAGRFAEERFSAMRAAHGKHWLHLLDDGFQHRRLARDFDIVLVTEDDPGDALLPAGRLREPLSELARADAMVLTGAARSQDFPIKPRHVWRATRHLDIGEPSLPPRAVAFCGIARPQRFLHDLREVGVEVRAHKFFRDHHRYSASDIEQLQRLRDSNGAVLVTTEKDAVNLGIENLSRLQPLRVFPVRMMLEEPEAAIQAILDALAERKTSV